MAVTGRALQFERLTLFSDAVFAIAITLLIIEIRLPHVEGETDIAMANAILALVPNYIGFIVSFFVVGRFWVGHHAAFGFIDDFDRTLVWRNLLFLGVIAFMPFPTAVIAEHASSRVAVIFYGAWLILAGVLNIFLFSYIAKLAAAAGNLDAETRALLRGGWMPVMIGALACAGSLIAPIFGLGALMLSPVLMRIFQRLTRPKPVAA